MPGHGFKTWVSGNADNVFDVIFVTPRDQVIELFSVTERTILNWIKAFNERGIDGLIEAKSPGAPPIIEPEQSQLYRELIENYFKHPKIAYAG